MRRPRISKDQPDSRITKSAAESTTKATATATGAVLRIIGITMFVVAATSSTTPMKGRPIAVAATFANNLHSRWRPVQRTRLSASSSRATEWTTDRVRETFVDYFKNQLPEQAQHTYQPSSACVPLNDPTLLFTNAGMNQFKSIFLGQVSPSSPLSQLQRAVNSQKCIRAGGKHNDLDDVGRDTYHHTFFEMLGTWSFGDYFKEDAVKYAWQLLTEVYRLNPDSLYATYFAGDDDVDPDLEARDLWLQYLPPERVIGCSAKDNFWEMGDVGPCGPCTEIHYDRIGGGRDAAALVNADDPDVIEIWNLVFIQYNREMVENTANGASHATMKLQSLPAKHIDTGMGLERLVSILQDKSSNYDIDCFQPLFKAIGQHTKLGPYTGRLGKDDEDLKDTAYRVIADHARTLTFAIADGATPSNEGRGYVLRRILRRAVRYGQQILGAPPGFFTTLIPVVVGIFGPAYPELVKQLTNVQEICQEEEDAFSTMLDRGIKYFNELQTDLESRGADRVSGQQAFFLYDTLGFPLDLTQLMAEESGLRVDVDGFHTAMQQQKDRSRQAQRAARAGAAAGTDMELVADQTAWLSDQGILPTDDGKKFKWDAQLPGTVLAIYRPSTGSEDDENKGFLAGDVVVGSDEFVGLVLDKTSFYAEAGGQETDYGTLDLTDNETGDVLATFAVTDVQDYAGFVLHKGKIVPSGAGTLSEAAALKVGTYVNCKVDYERRRSIAPNHSMTHVLNAALRKVLGDGVEQRGSLCNDEKLRFDFSHKKALTAKQLGQIESFCQQTVDDGLTVESQVLPLQDAQSINGVRAVFGEVYPDPVRVISIGDNMSVEFCGGTHLSNTAEAEAFALIEETAVAKGIRRVTAVTRDAARRAQDVGQEFQTIVADAEQLDAEKVPNLDKQAGAIRKELDEALISAALKAELRSRVEGIQSKAAAVKKKALQKRVDLCVNEVMKDVDNALVEGQNIMVMHVDIGADSKASQRVMNAVKDRAPELAFFGISEEEQGSGGKLMAFASVPESLISDYDFKADEWIRAALDSCGGRGGGRPNNAQGQAKECGDTAKVIDGAKKFAEALVKETAC